MNRSLAQWLAGNPVGAVLATGLLGLLPLLGIGVAFFLPGAVPALIVLVRGERQGVIVAMGASLLLAATMLLFGRPMAVGFIYSAWVLGPPLLLAILLHRTESMSLCLQVATLVGAVLLVALHGSLGDPQQFWAPFVRDLAQEMKTRGVPMDLEKDGLADTLARTLWGWVAVLTMTLAMCALFLARWWQTLPERAGAFGAEFRQIRLGRVLGVAAAVVIGVSLVSDWALVDDIGRLFLGSLVIVGLAAVHRAVSEGKVGSAWLWVTYATLVLVAPFAVIALAAWGFVDNWLRSQPPAA
ncbi:MAG: hypothetical protein RL030_2139 [Pseudomonadota bacterium]|jgi:hypothetical protein